MRLRKELILAAEDYKYLLNRGYNQQTVLNLVTSRYQLSSVERTLLLRCIHRDDDAMEIRSKIIDYPHGCELAIDGYNTILTVVSALEGRDLYLCDDCIVRDLRSSYIKDFSTPLILRAIELLRSELVSLRPRDIVFILDKNVSWSKKHAEIIKELIPESRVVLAKRADISVIATNYVICSSDYVVLKRALYIHDLAGSIVKKLFPSRLVRIDRIVCSELCNL